ncbi:MAG: hypothetical protein GY928_32260, partial [Colwellia sp.]|nr:hypothetical protein [Colwellia sp.]
KYDIDVTLIQEWTLIRKPYNKTTKTYTNRNNVQTKLIFPIEKFPNYKVHINSTEQAILYKQNLQITPLNKQPNYDKTNRTKNCHISSIILHHNNIDYSIHSLYKSPGGDITQMFEYETFTDHNIFAGDFNIHHQYWGSDRSTSESEAFMGIIQNTDLRILNAEYPQYTHIHKATKSKSNIDLTMISDSIKCTKWHILYDQFNKDFSDHIPIFTQISPINEHGYDTSHCTWNLTDNTKWQKYRKKLNEQIEITDFDEDPDLHTQELTDLILEIAFETIG